MRQIDPELGQLLSVVAGEVGSPIAGIGISYAVKITNRLLAAHGDRALQMTRDEVLAEARRMLAEELPDPATAAGEAGFHLVDDDGA